MKIYIIPEEHRNYLIQLLQEMPYKNVAQAIAVLGELKEEKQHVPPKPKSAK